VTKQKQAKRLARSKRIAKQANIRRNNLSREDRTGVKQVPMRVGKVNQFGKENVVRHNQDKLLQAKENRSLFRKALDLLNRD